MSGKSDQLAHPRKGEFTPFDIWEKGGLTEHIGGIYATQRLLSRCHLASGQHVLDIGCGTGYTACYLAKTYQGRVIALDIAPRSVTEARKRVSRQGADRQISLVQADAHQLPYSSAIYDAVVIESVMVFCNAAALITEIYRVLKPDGIVGVNEFTFLKPPPAELVTLLTGTLGIHTFQQEEWEVLLQGAGFVNVASSVHRISLWEQLTSHLEADGLKNYLAAFAIGIGDTAIRRTFFNKEMLTAARHFLPYVGYGIYTGKKAHEHAYRT